MTYTIIDAWKEQTGRRGLPWPPQTALRKWPEYEQALLDAHRSLAESERLACSATGEGE